MVEEYVSKEHFEEFRKLMDQRFDQAAKRADQREEFAKQQRADLRQFLEQRLKGLMREEREAKHRVFFDGWMKVCAGVSLACVIVLWVFILVY